MIEKKRNATAMTVNEAALFLGISTSLVYDLLHTGKIPYLRYGRAIRISLRDLYDFNSRCYHRRKEK